MTTKEFVKKEKELKETYQVKINKVRNELMSTVENDNRTIIRLREDIVELNSKHSNKINTLVNKANNATRDANDSFEHDKHTLKLEKQAFDIWAKNEEDKLKLQAANLMQMSTDIKEKIELAANAKYGEMVSKNFENLVQSVVDVKKSEVKLLK